MIVPKFQKFGAVETWSFDGFICWFSFLVLWLVVIILFLSVSWVSWFVFIGADSVVSGAGICDWLRESLFSIVEVERVTFASFSAYRFRHFDDSLCCPLLNLVYSFLSLCPSRVQNCSHFSILSMSWLICICRLVTKVLLRITKLSSDMSTAESSDISNIWLLN